MLGLVSTITLAVIFGFIFIIIGALTYVGGLDLNLPIVLGATALINFIGWLISPFFMDLMIRWIYKSQRMTIDDLAKRSPQLADFIKKICEKHHFKVPALRLINDDNPTAFTFGSGAYNARLCFSEGLFTYLEADELEAVIGHELGHIRRRDFIVMSIAATAVQMLYEISQLLRRRSGGDNKKGGGALAIIALVSYIFYLIGIYLMLFLSRVRELGADEFSAHETGNPDALSRALVKVAYGIVAKPDDTQQARLLQSTRALGLFDHKAARHLGTAYESAKHDWSKITPVIAYDLVSPWAKVMVLNSTHPLTGKRIQKLNAIAEKMGKKVSMNTDIIKDMHFDRGELYRGFFVGVLVYFLPTLAPLVVLGVAAYMQNITIAAWVFAAIGGAMVVRALYKYPAGQAVKSTTLDALSDITASPVRGKLYELEGTVIGRGMAGSYVSEDLMLQDSQGLIYLNYESGIPILGNLMFALSKVKKLIGKKLSATGWFFRDVGHHFDMKEFESEGVRTKSHPILWQMIFAAILVGVSIFAQGKLAGL